MKIKICGLRRVEDAEIVNCFPEIGYVGLVFANSKRQVNVSEAREIMKALREDIKVVGVFADMPIEDIKVIVEMLGLNIAQLHSNENNDMCKALGCEVWKSISIKNENSIAEALNYDEVGGFVLDTYSNKMRGGTGESFDWSAVRGFSKSFFTVLAGGIDKNNISEAIKNVSPNVIDISSSVETNGFKDRSKIFDFVMTYRKECGVDGVK